MKMKFVIGDQTISMVVTPAEFEMLYDALDALNDRYEQFAEDPKSDNPERAQKDLIALGKLDKEFQPVIKQIRYPKFGTNMPNGAIIIEIRGRVILAKNNCGTREEYVTWMWDGEDLRSTSYGHYFDNILSAAKDFSERSVKGA
jgi:hypothetical protein